jgi:nicotinate-nucleotide adenylyltransferase
MARIGLFGGTFNPVHVAHLRAAEEVREAATLDRVEFVLSSVPPHKASAGLESAQHRLRMLELAVAGNPAFAVNRSELDREGRSYSIDTIRAAGERDPDAALTFIVGADAFNDIESWKEFASIFALCDVCVLSRPGAVAERPPLAIENLFCYDSSTRMYLHRSGHALRFLPITPLMISASDIRQRRAAGSSVRYLVPDAVDAYMRDHGLYTTESAVH